MGKTSCTSNDGLRKGAWTEDEDNKLMSYVQQHGGQNWKSLPLKAGLMRCGKSCRLRWVNYLRPGSRRSHFSPYEEETITRLHSTMGNKWSAIAKQLYRRTDNEVKNYCNTRLKKRIAKDCVPQASEPSQKSPNVSGASIDTSTSSAQVLNSIASNASLIDIGRVLSDVEVGSPSNPTPQSSNAVSSDTMESQPVIKNLITESTINTNTSSTQVLSLIASNVSLIDIARIISDVEVGTPNNPTPQSSNAVSTDTMESQPVIENLLTESTTGYDDPYSTWFEQLLMDIFYDNL